MPKQRSLVRKTWRKYFLDPYNQLPEQEHVQKNPKRLYFNLISYTREQNGPPIITL